MNRCPATELGDESPETNVVAFGTTSWIGRDSVRLEELPDLLGTIGIMGAHISMV